MNSLEEFIMIYGPILGPIYYFETMRDREYNTEETQSNKYNKLWKSE